MNHTFSPLYLSIRESLKFGQDLWSAMRGVGYRRTSPGTNEEGTSLPGQTQAIESWAERQDHEIVEIFTDEDVSGQKTSPLDRDGFAEAKEKLLRDPEIEFVVAKTKDRYGRQMKDLFGLKDLLEAIHEERYGEQRNIRVLTTENETLDYRIERDGDSDPMEQIMDFMKEMMIVFMSSYEAAQTSQKTRSSLSEKQDKQQPVGRTPFGLTTDKQVFVDQDEATVYLPGDEFDDAWRVIEQYQQTDGPGSDDTPSAYSVGKDIGLTSPSKKVKRIWKNREKYERAKENAQMDHGGREIEDDAEWSP